MNVDTTQKELKKLDDETGLFGSITDEEISQNAGKTKDPRTEKQIKAYRKKEEGRAKWLADYRQWERYRMALGDKVPKTFETFQKHKIAGDDKYKNWKKLYRAENKEADAGE